MSTTIDSLQIEIQSNSNNAATSINNLAKALKKLNKNGDVSDAVKNLNDLRKSLHAFVNMPSSASKIESLAKSMKSLKKVGTIDLGTSLGSIKKALESLKSLDIDGVSPQIERLSQALTPLNSVKGSGFNALMNGFKKMDQVIDSLDSDNIDRFVAKIKELDEKLGPVSQKLIAIGNAFSGLNSKALSAGGGLSSFRNNVNVTTLNLQSMISVIQSAWSALQPIVNLLKYTIGEAIEWDGIEYQFGNAFGEQADEYYDKIVQITDALKINKQTFMENSAMAASMLKGFGVSGADSREMGLGYTELAYDIWAAYNNVYKTLEGADGAMAAVRSAIAGEVEPIRRAGFTIVESQLEITAANHGIAYSSEKATEAQKSYLRYLTLVEQAHSKGIVGTYASEMDKAEGMVRTFTQQLTSLAQTFGSLFLPILVKVMPWLQAFVDLLNDAVIAVANFFGVDIQKVDFSDSFSGAGESADSATESINGTKEALKELKNATLGFDELNVISPNSGNGSGAGSGGGADSFGSVDIGSLWDKSIYDTVQDQVDELKKKIKDLLPTIGGIGLALGALRLAALLDDLDLSDTKFANLEKKIKGLSKGFTVASIVISVGALVWDLTGAYLDSGSLLDGLAALGTTAIGTGLAYKFGGKSGAAFTLLASGIVTLSRLAFDLSEGTVDFGDPEAWITLVFGGIETAIAGAFAWKLWGPKITAAVKGMFSGANLAAIGGAVGGALSSGWASITAALAAIPVWGWIAAAVVAVIGAAVGLAVVDYDFTDIGQRVGEAIGIALKYFNPIGWVITIGKWLVDAVKGAIDYFKQFGSFTDFLAALQVKLFDFADRLSEWKENFIDAGREMVNGVTEGFKNGWNNLMGNLGEFFTGFWKGICKVFGIASPAKKMTPVGRYIVEGIWSGISGAFSWIVTNVTKWATDLISKITGAMKPSAIRDKLSAMWTDAKNWWNKSKEALKAYTPGIGSIKDKVSSAWTDAKKWWNDKKEALKAYTPSIGSVKDKLSSAWASAKTWWDKTRSSLSYTPTIGSIKSNLSSAWSSAKSWWNDKKGALSYTPSIGSIKDTLSSAWNVAKLWWKNNVKLSIPSLSLKVTYATEGLGTVKKAIVTALGLQGWPQLSFAASGGIFDMGSLVWAGERGPEIVANAGGGKTGVMNVQQMSEAVYEGVYSAVVAAMQANGGNGGAQYVNVYLDGKQITATVEKHQKNRGATLMTGGMAYGY